MKILTVYLFGFLCFFSSHLTAEGGYIITEEGKKVTIEDLNSKLDMRGDPLGPEEEVQESKYSLLPKLFQKGLLKEEEKSESGERNLSGKSEMMESLKWIWNMVRDVNVNLKDIKTNSQKRRKMLEDLEKQI